MSHDSAVIGIPDSHPFCAAILGPTGSGKTELALALAAQFHGEIVNFDSVQVYCGFDIGSAKPSTEERRSIPHHLIDIASATADITAGEYARLARTALLDISRRGNLPILAGGTGLYLRALLDGLSPAPKRCGRLRERLGTRSPAVLHRFLRRFDPSSAQRIHANDRQKLIRAVEIAMLARQPASEVQAAPRQRLAGFSILKIGLSPERAKLTDRLNARTEQMLRSGLIEETSRLLAAGVPRNAKPMQSLGYKQSLDVIAGDKTIDEAIAECQLRTRQYAKRQMTWFRRERNVHWFYGFGSDLEIQNQAIDFVRQRIWSRSLQ